MPAIEHLQRMVLRSRRLPLAIIALALLALAGAVGLTTLQLRQRLREQIAGRDGEVLHAVALLHYAQDVEDGLAGPITDPGNQLTIVLKSAQLRGVLGVRLFNPAGRFVESFPPDVIEEDLDPRDLPELRGLHPVSRFHAEVPLSAVFYRETKGVDPLTPLLEVSVPLSARNGPLAGIAQFLVEGHSIAREFNRLDRSLARQALAAFVAGALLLVLGLGWALRRLRRTHELLAERTQSLIQANDELALSAKTSALGAVTAHLLHGLKNPLAGLQNFVAAHGGDGAPAAPEWQQAIASTTRMRAMINEVIEVIRSEEGGASFELTSGEIAEILRRRTQPAATRAGVELKFDIMPEVSLPSHAANLVILILANLLENALAATPRGKRVVLALRFEGDRLVWEVQDEGPGFPSGVPLFMPCRSSKDGGSGIGLALCRQLANHLGADLQLSRNTPAGCVFRLSLPQPRPALAREHLELAGAI